MAFPTIQTADTKNGVVTSNSTSWTITYPTNLVSGDLILLFTGADGNGAINALPAGWVFRNFQQGATTISWAKKMSDGTETGTFTATMSASEQGGWRCFRITGWEGTLGTDFVNDANSGAAVAPTASSGTTDTPDPPSLDPNNWATEDTLWFAVCSVDTSRTISVYPLPDLNTADVSGGAGGATLGICMDDLAQASLDPGTFTISASDDWAALTIAIRPAAGGAERVPCFTTYPQLLAH